MQISTKEKFLALDKQETKFQTYGTLHDCQKYTMLVKEILDCLCFNICKKNLFLEYEQKIPSSMPRTIGFLD